MNTNAIKSFCQKISPAHLIFKLALSLLLALTGGGVQAQEPMHIQVVKSQFIGNYNITCYGEDDGWINITVTGGTTPYTFLWNNNATTEDLSNLTAGAYSVLVTDSTGDTLSQNNILLVQPTVIQPNFEITNITCHGANDGSAKVTVQGGTPPYSFLWMDNSTHSNIENLGAVSVSITVTDANQCIANAGGTVTEPSAISASLSSPVNSNGFNVSAGQRDGVINLTVSGGTSPYHTDWSNGSFSEDLDNLDPGTYSVLITDDHECQYLDSITLTSEDSLVPGAMPITNKGNWLNPSTDFIGTKNVAALRLSTSNQERMRIAENGNVGIGTTMPQAKLHVNGDIITSGTLKFNNPPATGLTLAVIDQNGSLGMLNIPENSCGDIIMSGGIGFSPNPDVTMPYWSTNGNIVPDNSGNKFIGTCNPKDLVFKTNNIERMRIMSSGDVGIGTSNPDSKLTVNGDVSIAGSRFHVANNGQVGVGTTNIPTGYMFAVTGKIIAENIMIKSVANWYDNVFENGYELMSLDSLENFLERNKHIPGMPSAKEVAANGISASDMIGNLLKTQEELLLYIIKQGKRITYLEKNSIMK